MKQKGILYIKIFSSRRQTQLFCWSIFTTAVTSMVFWVLKQPPSLNKM